jgi:hypothetical protein
VPLDWSFLPLSENPNYHPPKTETVQPADVFEDTAFKVGFEIAKL